MSQEPFIKQTASVNFLFWETPQYPVICFVAAAFLIGLFTVLIIAVIDSFQKNKVIKGLKKESGKK
jgi:uncharacterized integral membrane protein